MSLRIFLPILFIFFSNLLFSQPLDQILVDGKDWRMCGHWEDSDTLVLKRIAPNTKYYSCNKVTYTQLLVYDKLRFRILIWEYDVCNIFLSGFMEMNDETGEFRFYFEDGTSLDFILLYADMKKIVLVNRRY